MSYLLTTSLEKSVKLPVGTRRIYGSGKNMQWFKKAANGKWEYDGQVSPTERAEEEKKQKAKAKAKALRAKSKKKTKEVLTKVEAEKQSGTTSDKSKPSNADKPDPATLATLPKKQQIYYDDTTTDRARDLCDKTGILCVDKTAEDYLETNLRTIFKLDKQQQDLVDGLSALDTVNGDQKWIDDPVFVQDTLKELKDQLRFTSSPKGRGKLIQSVATKNGLTHTMAEDVIDKTIEELKETILNIEQHANDKIVLSKMRALEKGMRGLKTIDDLGTALISTMLPELTNIYGNWNTLSDDARDLLAKIGITTIEQFNSFNYYNSQSSIKSLVLLSMIDGGDKIIKHFTDNSKHFNRANQRNTRNQYTPGDPEYVDPTKLGGLGADLKTKYPVIARMINDLYKIERPENIALTSNIQYATNFNGVLNTIGQYSYNQTNTALKPKSTITWRGIGTDLKNAMRSKALDWSKHAELFDTIKDTAKVMGNTGVASSYDTAYKKMESYYEGLTPGMRNSIVLSPQLFNRFTGSMVMNKIPRSNSMHTSVPDQGFLGYNSVTASKTKTVRRRYYSPRTVSADLKQSRYSTVERFGETKRLKSAIRMKTLSITSISSGNTQRSIGSRTHGSASISMGIGANWQNRKLSKKSGIIPEWQWGGARPLSQANSVPVHVQGNIMSVSGNKGSTAHGHISAGDYSKVVMDLRQSGIIKHLGLTSGKVATGSKQVPKLVIRTNSEGVSGWQSKVDKEWTHDDPRINTRKWDKGSLQVNNVFDLMYHDYFGDYKKAEQVRGNVTYGWHGTNFEAGQSIIKTGYDRGGGLLGTGQYIAKSSSKAAGYLGGGAGNWNHNVGARGVLTWNRVAMGKVNPSSVSYTDARYDKQWDTVYGAGITGGGSMAGSYGQLQHDEWCVKDFKAVVPLQWVDVTIVKAPG